MIPNNPRLKELQIFVSISTAHTVTLLMLWNLEKGIRAVAKMFDLLRPIKVIINFIGYIIPPPQTALRVSRKATNAFIRQNKKKIKKTYIIYIL